MSFQTVFKRYELKYLMTLEQKEKVLEAIAPYMKLDEYGRTTIRNIYYDTDSYLLARRSIEKPVYKEKLRMRSYELCGENSTVFVELKKKYEQVVYKRRLALGQSDAASWLNGNSDPAVSSKQTQIASEIDYFLDHYETLHPVVFLSYEREAFFATCGSDFRITFDDTILCRQNNLCLAADVSGTPLLPENMVLMEVKCSGGFPLWMTKILSEEHLYKSSFSKYGTAYQTIIYPQLQKQKEN